MEEKRSQNVEINNHVDADNFESNFNGIKDLFIKLMGP